MQNIEAILKQFNIEVPKEQSEEFRKVFHENYKTVTVSYTHLDVYKRQL